MRMVCLSLLSLSLVAFAKPAQPKAPYLKSKYVYAVPQSYVDHLNSNLADTLSTARAVPAVDADGKIKGFKMEYLDKKSEFRKLGLLPGDVMVQINDVVLDNGAKGLEAFQNMRNSKTVKLHLLRKSKKIVLTYDTVK